MRDVLKKINGLMFFVRLIGVEEIGFGLEWK